MNYDDVQIIPEYHVVAFAQLRQIYVRTANLIPLDDRLYARIRHRVVPRLATDIVLDGFTRYRTDASQAVVPLKRLRAVAANQVLQSALDRSDQRMGRNGRLRAHEELACCLVGKAMLKDAHAIGLGGSLQSASQSAAETA